LVEDLGESEDGAYGVAVGAGVGGEKEAGMSAEDGQESGDMGIRLGLKLGLGREDLTRAGCGSMELQEFGFGCHGLAVTG
jgi:hypothetical protein